jgi:hypothetical protein
MYRLEACPCCNVVRAVIVTALTMQRERDGIDRPENIGGAQVYWVDFCADCRRLHDAASPTGPRPGASA